MKPTVIVLGSGPIRIGQGIEFDYSCVHCVRALRDSGYRAVIINNNPETVSTDFDTGDGLYFEPVTFPDVMRVIQHEKPIGVVTQFGGQTAINLAQPLYDAGVTILGTQPKAIADAEDRDLFEKLLVELGVPKPPGKAVRSLDEAAKVADEIGYPVVVRPSFVLGGRAMEIVHDPEHLAEYYHLADDANPGQPVLVDKYLIGVEAEVDVISDGVDTLVPGIMEHIERAGIHSGDSMAVYPPVTISRELQSRMVEIACGIARTLGIKGLMNIQFVIDGGEVFVIEVNPRASRTVPYLTKVCGIPMVRLATACMMGGKLADMGYRSGLWCGVGPQEQFDSFPSSPESPRIPGRVVDQAEFESGEWEQTQLFAVKAPVFSFQKLTRVEPSLGPEMKSTGEVLGIDFSFEAALYKALVAAGVTYKSGRKIALTVNDHDKAIALDIARELVRDGHSILASRGTHAFLKENGIESELVEKIQDGEPNFLTLLANGEIGLMINTPSLGGQSTDEAKRIRRACIETGVPSITSIDTGLAFAKTLAFFRDPSKCVVLPVGEYLTAETTRA